jgi:hypothetical protein
VGGGLTSAQVTATLLHHGVSKVHQLVRGPLKVRHFDLDLPWVGKYRNFHLASFWGADSDRERADMIREARGGGSITPEYKKILHELVKSRRLELRDYTTITRATWDEAAMCWEVGTEPQLEMPPIDHVVYATGVVADFETVPAVQPLLQQYGIETVGGMPCLTNDLMWNDEIPLFVTGRLAGLRLGPAAGNLEGARQGAERIAWKVGELLKKWDGVDQNLEDGYGREEEEEVDSRRLGLGLENQFGVLGLSEVEC